MTHICMCMRAICIMPAFAQTIAAASIEGPELEITRVTRLHMGPYLCIASNGVPPTVSKRIVLIVHCMYNFAAWEILGSCFTTGVMEPFHQGGGEIRKTLRKTTHLLRKISRRCVFAFSIKLK